MPHPDVPEPSFVTVRTADADTLEFTFDKGQKFLRKRMRDVVGWSCIRNGENDIRIELECRDENCAWVTEICKDRWGEYVEVILMPRYSHSVPAPIRKQRGKRYERIEELAVA